MKRKKLTVIGVFFVTGVVFFSLWQHLGASFNANHLMDDGVFDDYTSMNSSQIDAWLNNNFPNSCISTNSGFKAPDPTGYKPNPSQFLYSTTPVTAGKVVYDAAQAYQINPQVLLATLQKEESLVDGSAGCSTWRFASAMGYGCTDSGTNTHNYSYPSGGLVTPLFYRNGSAFNSITGSCVNSGPKTGFSEQVIHAAWLLAFGRHKSEGDTGWAVVNGNWDNCDDNDTCPLSWNIDPGLACYGGPMTQGYRKLCPTDSNTVYYDGYATIDGTSVHMDTGATAAFYWYTPHLSGNESFVSLFTGWFGSTSFPQPLGAALYRQSSSGSIYLTFTSSDGSTTTRYYIPSWSILTNYGLNKYATIPATDNTINSMTDGGVLYNTIRDSSGNIYLVNKGAMDYISGATLCTAWGLDCFDSNVTHTLSQTFETGYLKNGLNLASSMNYNGAYYLLNNGIKQPFANTQSFTGAGYSTSQAITADASNATQPLGTLIITTPGIIKFSPKPNIYYYDGGQYYAINSMSVYDAWKLGGVPALAAPVSSYNQSDDPTVAATVSLWYVDGSGNKYVVDNGRKFELTTSQQAYWPGATYINAPDGLASRLTQASLSQFVKGGIDLFQLSGAGTKEYLPSMEDYKGLGGNNTNTISLSTALTDPIADGPFALANGHLLKIDNGGSIYVVYNSQLLHIPDMDTFWAYNFTSGISHFTSADLSGSYNLAGDLGITKTADGSAYYPYSKQLLYLTPNMAVSYGADLSSYQQIDSSIIKSSKPKLMTAFLRDSDTGKIYYASGGAIHYVSSQNSFIKYGGNRIPVTSVDTAIINSFLLEQPI